LPCVRARGGIVAGVLRCVICGDRGGVGRLG
jgi:hypothetical protein